MELYSVVLFVHVVAAIGLVGGTAWLHLSTVLARRAATVDGARSQVEYIGTVTKASMPFALVTVAAGLYLAFAGDHWGAGWPGVSLGLFVVAGAIAGGAIAPGVAALREVVDAAPAGPVPHDVREAMADRRLVLLPWVLTGVDLAIVFLMTVKPALGTSLAVGALGVALGVVLGARETRHLAGAPAAPAV
ncbi:MAG: DUF2269 family protein [Actinomycetes bacterium]